MGAGRVRATLVLAAAALVAVLSVASAAPGTRSPLWTWGGGVPGERSALADGLDPEAARAAGLAPGSVRELVSIGDGGRRLALLAGESSGGPGLAALAGDRLQAVSPAGPEDALATYEAAGATSRLVGVSRADVQRVVATRRDGEEVELPLNRWRAFAYEAASAPTAVAGLAAYDEGGLRLGSVRIPATAAGCAARASSCASGARARAAPSRIFGLFTGGQTQAPTFFLARIDPRTLAPLPGPRLRGNGYAGVLALSPSGTRLAFAAGHMDAVRVADLERMRLVRRSRARPDVVVRVLSWPREDRLLEVEQRMSRPYARYVRSRTLVVADPATGRVLVRRKLTNKLAIGDSVTAGGRLVLLLQPSSLKGPLVDLVVADATGSVRQVAVNVVRERTSLRIARLVVDPAGRHAYVVVSGGDVVEVDLDTLHPTVHHLQLSPGTPRTPPSTLSVGGAMLGDDLVVTGIFGTPQSPRGGVYLVDTGDWSVRVLDPRTSSFTPGGDVLVTYGSAAPVSPAAPGGRPRKGIGVTLYGRDGRRRFHVYDGQAFSFVQLVPGYGHVYTGWRIFPSGRQTGKHLAFELGTGRSRVVRATGPAIAIYRGSPFVGEVPGARRAYAFRARPVQPRAFGRPARPTDTLPSRARDMFGGLDDSRQVASYVDGRGRVARLYLARTHDGQICTLLRWGGGIGGGCGPGDTFFRPGHPVVGTMGHLFAGVAAPGVARVEIVGIRGGVHRPRLSGDDGFVYDCRAYNGCICLIRSVRAYAANGLLVGDESWLGSGCSRIVRRTQQAADRYTFANRGQPILLREARRFFNGHAPHGRLLGVLAGRAFYRLQPTAKVTCFATGDARKLGEIGEMGCGGFVGSQPLVEFNSGFSSLTGPQHLVRLEGFAADQVATVAAVDKDGKQLATTTPTKNLYVFAKVPSGAVRGVALDAAGKILRPRPTHGRPPQLPPSFEPPHAVKVDPSSIRPPIRHGEAKGIAVDAGANGVAVFRTAGASAEVARLLRGLRIGYGCFRLRGSLGETVAVGVSRPFEPVVALKAVGIRAPFDGCEIQGAYGHRWHDRYGPHSAVEVALDERARRYFEDRAAARDLALLVRSRKMQSIRRETGTTLRLMLRRAYGRSLVELHGSAATAPTEQVGYRITADGVIFSERSTTGARFFVEIERGKIVRKNLGRLAFVF